MDKYQVIENIVKELNPDYVKCLVCKEYILKHVSCLIKSEGNEKDAVCQKCHKKIQRHCQTGKGSIRCPVTTCRCIECYSHYKWVGGWTLRKTPLLTLKSLKQR